MSSAFGKVLSSSSPNGYPKKSETTRVSAQLRSRESTTKRKHNCTKIWRLMVAFSTCNNSQKQRLIHWPNPVVIRYRGRGQSSCATFATPTHDGSDRLCSSGNQTDVCISYMDLVMCPLPRVKRIRTGSGKQTVMYIPAPFHGHWWAS